MNFTKIFCVSIIVVAAWTCFMQPVASTHSLTRRGETASFQPCTLPTAPASTNEETAWRIFAAINCQSNGQLTWETWPEQYCWLNPGKPGCSDGAKVRRLHASKLQVKNLADNSHLPDEGSAMLTLFSFSGPKRKQPPASLKPFVPKNLVKGAQFYEEVHVSPAETTFITSPPGGTGMNLLTLTGQAAYLNATTNPLQFPTGAVETKMDWLPSDSLNSSVAFDCDKNKPKGVYTEVIEGKCYALVGMHISSKLFPNWLWATFEPQNKITNPNRCNPKLYNQCIDPWGSNPAVSMGADTAATKNLTDLMDQARLAPELRNYRLVGTQTDYDQPVASGGSLGNSFVEFNAQVPPHQSSCVTCHSYAMMNVATTLPRENQYAGPFPGNSHTGRPGKIPPGNWQRQDFSWFLGFMPQK